MLWTGSAHIVSWEISVQTISSGKGSNPLTPTHPTVETNLLDDRKWAQVFYRGVSFDFRFSHILSTIDFILMYMF